MLKISETDFLEKQYNRISILDKLFTNLIKKKKECGWRNLYQVEHTFL